MSDVLQLGATFIGAQPASTGYSTFTSLNFSSRPPLKPNEQFVASSYIRKLIANAPMFLLRLMFWISKAQ